MGLKELPCIIKENLTEDETKIYLIDTNLCTRENISPMERARAYKIKQDTYKKRNIKTSVLEEVKKDNYGMAKATMIKEEKSSNGTYLKDQRKIEHPKVSMFTVLSLYFFTICRVLENLFFYVFVRYTLYLFPAF